jgi:putative transposase
MARIARVTAAGVPHHITQRGNRRMPTFFRDEDYQAYIELMGEWCLKSRVEIWAYCLMPNHVHLIAVPELDDGLRRGIGEAHRRYSRMINSRENWRGHLWQGRFASFPLDENYLLATARYIEMNPVRSGLTREPHSWRWSSARAHLLGMDDKLVKVSPLLEIVGDWMLFLSSGGEEEKMEHIRRHERTGRPLGDGGFVEKLESTLKRTLKCRKPGPKRPDN